jgi:thiosulfate/3-mercaptopyruvate sulfurtransferase
VFCFTLFNFAFAKVGIISTQEVASMIGKKGVVIIDTRPQEAYLKAHLPNAINLTPTGEFFSEKYGVKAASIANNTQLEEALSNAGILPTDTVVVYSGGDNPAFFLTNATRVILALKWAGVENVYFMNGGFEKWADEKKPLQSGKVKLSKTKFVIAYNTPQTYVFVFSNFVEWAVNNENKIQIVDVRPMAQYTGEFTSDKRLAKYVHIKGALNLPVGEYVKKVDNYFLVKTP